MVLLHLEAGHTLQDIQGDFGPISPLLTILGKVPIILFCGVLRVNESAWKNVRAPPNLES